MAQDRGQNPNDGSWVHIVTEMASTAMIMDGMELAAQHCIGQLIVPDSAAAPSMLRRAASS